MLHDNGKMTARFYQSLDDVSTAEHSVIFAKEYVKNSSLLLEMYNEINLGNFIVRKI